jgi:hypothetical protein
VARGGGGLQPEGPGRPEIVSPSEGGEAGRDGGAVPPATVLVLERQKVTRFTNSRATPRRMLPSERNMPLPS